MSPSVFSMIVRGEALAHRVWEDETFLAFLDTSPVQPGHLLLIPKEEIDDVFDLPAPLYARLWARARWLAGPLRAATGAVRIGIVVEGFGVAHAHVHLVPLRGQGDLDGGRQQRASEEELARVAGVIREAIAGAEPMQAE